MGGVAPVQPHVCPCCGTVLKQPKWWERVNDGEMACVWRCAKCNYYSETRVKSFGHEPSAAELAEEFLPKLVVE
jgi:hypothetical protein